jgi:hypothetical protein
MTFEFPKAGIPHIGHRDRGTTTHLSQTSPPPNVPILISFLLQTGFIILFTQQTYEN